MSQGKYQNSSVLEQSECKDDETIHNELDQTVNDLKTKMDWICEFIVNDVDYFA